MERLRHLTQELMIPPPLEVNFAGIPEVLKTRPQWVVWTYRMQEGEIKKPPLSPKTGKLASVISPDTWGSFAEAQSVYETGKIAGKPVTLAGVGFVLTTGMVGIDLDHCINEGQINDEATLIAAALHTYTEFSPSGTGLHLIMEGSLPGKYRRKGNLEMYETGRYLTVTGHSIQDPPLPLSQDQNALDAVYYHLFSQLERKENTGVGEAHRAEWRSFIHRRDAEVLEKAYAAKNGETFRRYFEGDFSLFEGKGARHRSHSEADFTLVLLLLYWTNRDVAQVDRLFRHSGLMREKWDKKIKGNETYGERIITDATTKGNQ